jgi:diketogulonate reductase-like aldo/keto reductase
MQPDDPDRRRFLSMLAGAAALAGMGEAVATPAPSPILRTIPTNGETIPAIGMGSWLTFDVGDDLANRAVRRQVLERFLALGGRLIDSSPMYGSSEEVIGWGLRELGQALPPFTATKVWTVGREEGIAQMERSRRLWNVERFDLMQIHNMLDWEVQLETLKAMKAAGEIRHIGITTSHGRRHRELEQALTREQFDFVQFTYNVIDREAEQRLLPLAAERGIAVIVNRPFQGGQLFRRVWNHKLPGWAVEIDCTTWSQVFLKFVISHPAVTCAIPATSSPDHMQENMGALQGPLPDTTLRRRMAVDMVAL